MDDRQLVCYPRNGTCSLRRSVCCFLLIISPFKYPLQIPHHDQHLRCWSPLTSEDTILLAKVYTIHLTSVEYFLNKSLAVILVLRSS